ncbi:STAS domain-containing protein [Acidobacteria bacterium AB60]|nr:STAS domain-containing protein [Acidobacteria bacterium AB60]
MEITQHPAEDALELRLSGRLDATWAEHVNKSIENAVRAGSHHIVLNFAGVEYISSLGIRVLVVQYKRLKAVDGGLVISNPNEFCRNVLTTVGLAEMLRSEPAKGTALPEHATALTLGGATYSVYPLPTSRPLSCTLSGNPLKLSSGFEEKDVKRLEFPAGSFGIGLGAFGEHFNDCSGRFGEFLSAGGCVITLPTNDTHALSDFVVEQGALVPRIESLYAITGTGDFSSMVRFDAVAGGPGAIPLSEFVSSMLAIADASAIGFVALAETAGLIGASLLKSPAGNGITRAFPEVRDWLSFTTERTAEKSLAILVGVAGRNLGEDAAAFVRPIKAGSNLEAHIHAASFPYRVVPRGNLDYSTTIAGTLSSATPGSVLHLMADTRPYEGAGETDLTRGACWMGPLTTIARG